MTAWSMVILNKNVVCIRYEDAYPCKSPVVDFSVDINKFGSSFLQHKRVFINISYFSRVPLQPFGLILVCNV